MSKFKVGDMVKYKYNHPVYNNIRFKVILLSTKNDGHGIIYNKDFDGHNAQLDPLLGYGNHCHCLLNIDYFELDEDYLLDLKLSELK